MKRVALVVLILIVAACSMAVGHHFGYQKGQSVAAQRPKPAMPAARLSTPDVYTDPVSMPPSEPQPAAKPAPAVAAAPVPSAIPEEKPGTTFTLAQGDLKGFRFSLGGGEAGPEPTGDRARYPGIAILESECGVTEGQVQRMFQWLKTRDEAYNQLSQIKDPAVYAAQGQWTKDYYESLFRNEMTPDQQKKYDDLKKEGSFSFRGPPEMAK